MNQTTPPPAFFITEQGRRLAYIKTDAPKAKTKKSVVFLGGLMSDMDGKKATFLEQLSRDTGFDYVRFDYSGHGRSEGDFITGTLSRWTEDAFAIVDHFTQGPVVLVGSSMGGWIMLNIACRRPKRVQGLVGVAPAPDFTRDLMWDRFDPQIKETLRKDGLYLHPSDYGDPYPITLTLIKDGKDHLLLDNPIPIHCPVHILQGMADNVVPWTHAPRIVTALNSTEVTLTLTKDGDHSLSRGNDLEKLKKAVLALL